MKASVPAIAVLCACLAPDLAWARAPRSLLGSWALEETRCVSGSDALLNIGPDHVDSFEESCAIRAARREGRTFVLDLECEAEGRRSTRTMRLTLRSGRLSHRVAELRRTNVYRRCPRLD